MPGKKKKKDPKEPAVDSAGHKVQDICMIEFQGKSPGEINLQIQIFFQDSDHRNYRFVDVMYSYHSWKNNRVHVTQPEDFWGTATILYTEN